MCSGKQKHIINGNIEITLNKGELLLLNQHARHSTGFADKDDIVTHNIYEKPSVRRKKKSEAARKRKFR